MSDRGLMGRLSTSLRKAWQGSSRGNIDERVAGQSEAMLLFRRARALARTGSFDIAARLYADASEVEPNFAEAMEACGEVLDLKGQRILAVEQYERARKVRAGTRLGAWDRHFVLRQRGHFIAEIMAYDAVVRSLTKNTLPYLARGNAYLAAGQPLKALSDYNRALALKPKSPEITAVKGEALAMLHRYEEALNAFDDALVIHPDNAETLNGRAISRIALGRVDEANADWHRQFELLAGNVEARACVALRLADYALALPSLDAALSKRGSDPYLHLYRLTAQRRLGIPQASIEMPATGAWPAPLFALYAGRMSEDETLKRADTDGRRAETLFQVGVLAFAADRSVAERCWREIVERAAPSLIEYAAARNELLRLAS